MSGLHGYSSPGSSPRMRGARRMGARVSEDAGMIPAYAGSTPRTPGSGSVPRDHPRVCGEHYRSKLSTGTAMGSSPRMRGAPHKVTEEQRHVGIIPAYAGSTKHSCSANKQSVDHPRVCGEHDQLCKKAFGRTGSSPRMRGARRVRARRRVALGIIPAYAGSTS